jgi:hypothetical protein
MESLPLSSLLRKLLIVLTNGATQKLLLRTIHQPLRPILRFLTFSVRFNQVQCISEDYLDQKMGLEALDIAMSLADIGINIDSLRPPIRYPCLVAYAML